MLIKKINNDMNITYDWYNRIRKPKAVSFHAYNFNEIFDNNRNNILYFSYNLTIRCYNLGYENNV